MVDEERLGRAVEAAWNDRELLAEPSHAAAVEQVLAHLDAGLMRAAIRGADGAWCAHPFAARAILLYFAMRKIEPIDHGPFHYLDKIPLKRDLEAARVRVVPPGTVRYGAHLEPGVILMPGYVNIGAWVGSGTMVDTWATVGSCAQIGERCHLSGGVGIGGVLEPLGSRPVVIEDDVFVGSRAIVVEGVVVEREAVLAANVVLTSSSAIIDVTGPEPVEHRGRVPARSVVVPGTRSKRFPAGEFGVACALIIGQRKESTDRKTSLNQALRDYGVSV